MRPFVLFEISHSFLVVHYLSDSGKSSTGSEQSYGLVAITDALQNADQIVTFLRDEHCLT